ncbi:MAG: hypothetical protein UFM30_00710 [Bacteroidales bacterium]|nr:hypothetical protein [Bacteroidales bacterium]
MIRKILHTFCMVALVLVCLSCVREELATPVGGASGGEGWLMLDFGVNNQVSVQTKATLPEYAEGRVLNMYVVVFDKGGNKLSSGFFDASPSVLMSSAEEVSNGNRNCWFVKNPTNAGGTSATGRVLMKCAAGTDLKVYVIANLDSDMAKVSSDLLSSTIHDESNIQNFEVFLNQTTVSRNGYFPMTCKVDKVDISASASGSVTRTIIQKGVELERIDSKIKFIFKTGNTPDAKGQTIEKFEARQWRVVNVPRKSYLLSYEDRGVTEEACGHDIVNVDPNTSSEDYSKYAAGFFTTDFVNFEEFPADGSAEFSFYMMENRQKPKKTPIINYQDRSRAIKDKEGLNKSCQVSYTLNGVDYTRDMRMFEYANDFSTYVVVTGYVTMKLHDDEAGKVLGGEVEYLIHLGDWREKEGSIDNYNIERNTSYTYTVTINSLNSIRVEVETSQAGQTFTENQPGATGQISIAKEEIALCDCHYESKTISFHLSNFFKNGKINRENCIVDELTWSVKTPFGEGEPKIVNGVESVTGLDYQWVHFRLNKRGDDGNYYSDKRRKYTDREFAASETWRDAQQNAEEDGANGLPGFHNDGIMTVPYLCKYIKEQVKKYLDNPAVSDFDGSKSEDGGPKISLTVFVDEFYYDKNPVTSETRSDLWKYFVNKDDRKLHILCNSVKSLDGESSMTGSVVTIQQSSIQCVYNTDPSYTALQTAWGVENADEDAGRLVDGKYWSVTSDINNSNKDNRNNNDQFNGLYNSCKEWGLSIGTGNTFDGGIWSTYMDYEVANSTPQLNSDHKYMRYACMNRNRDNNGDGKIDRNEVRWYLASIRQLVGMYVGDGLLNSKTKLYNKSAADRESNEISRWQQHIVSSTNFGNNSNNPTILWAEEGTSTSLFYHNWGSDIQGSEIRCVRNLGNIDGNSEESYPIDKAPDDYIVYDKDSRTFTCTHLNSQALRYYTSKELIYSDERSQENRLYKKFEVAPESGTLGMTFDVYNDAVSAAVESGKRNSYCPDGYRTPSQIEAAIMRYYIGINDNITRTYWSFGAHGKNPKSFNNGTVKNGFSVQSGNVTVNDASVTYIRCVRDVRTD